MDDDDHDDLEAGQTNDTCSSRVQPPADGRAEEQEAAGIVETGVCNDYETIIGVDPNSDLEEVRLLSTMSDRLQLLDHEVQTLHRAKEKAAEVPTAAAAAEEQCKRITVGVQDVLRRLRKKGWRFPAVRL